MEQGKKKKQPKNAFYFFMVDFKSQQERKGVRFPGGMKDVAVMATPAWKSMKPEDRWIYEEEARREKERDKINLENKFTTQGKSYAQLERERNEEAEKKSKMLNDIQCTVRSLDYRTTLQTHTFHIIHVNYYCRQENGVYTPCEIALAEFNFTDGVRKVYHTLINPGQIPLGYSYEASKLSSETHQIPVPPVDFGGETDYYKILGNVKRFVTKEDNDIFTSKEGMYAGKKKSVLAPYYAHFNCIDAVESVLSKLQDDFSEKIEFHIYPLTELFFELRNACAPDLSRGFPTRTIAEMELDKDVFNFTRGISCNFHEETDAIPHCSLSCVRRWCFLIMDYCCKDLGIDLIPGQHCPRQAATSVYQRSSSQTASETASLASLKSIPKSTVRHQGAVPSGPEARAVLKIGTTPGVVSINKDSESLTPLRLPKTQPEAFRAMGVGQFTEEHFPAIGARKQRVPSGVQEKEPIAVAGRGRPISKLTNPITIGRGRALANISADFKQMNLE